MKTNFTWYFLRWACDLVKTFTGLIGVLSFGIIRIEHLDLKMYGYFLDYTEVLNKK